MGTFSPHAMSWSIFETYPNSCGTLKRPTIQAPHPPVAGGQGYRSPGEGDKVLPDPSLDGKNSGFVMLGSRRSRSRPSMPGTMNRASKISDVGGRGVARTPPASRPDRLLPHLQNRRSGFRSRLVGRRRNRCQVPRWPRRGCPLDVQLVSGPLGERHFDVVEVVGLVKQVVYQPPLQLLQYALHWRRSSLRVRDASVPPSRYT